MKALITGASSGIGAAFARKLAFHPLYAGTIRKISSEDLSTSSVSVAHLGGQSLQAVLTAGDQDKVVSLRSKISELDALDLLIDGAGFGTSGHSSMPTWRSSSL